MIQFPDIDPVAIELFGLSIKWYGIAYAVGLLLGLTYSKFLSKKTNTIIPKHFDDILIWVALGTIIGGRTGYVIFYDLGFYLYNPSLIILDIRKGGMSFHGGLIGVAIFTFFYSRLYKLKYLIIMDIISCCAPIGLFLGRIANFINSELWGKTTLLPWGIVFPNGGNNPRHPSQLYEAMLEGLLLFILLNVIYRKNYRKYGYTSFSFLIIYGIFRFLIEFVREPDQQLGYIYANIITTGMLLSMPMILLGIVLLVIFNAKYRKYT